MADYFVDRKPTIPNRYKITPASGSAYYATLERADEPTEAGTALNASVLNGLIANLANLHVWEKHSGDPDNGVYGPSDIKDIAFTLVQDSSSVSPTVWFTGKYSDSFTVTDGVVSLVNPVDIPTDYTERDRVIPGKYITAKRKTDDSTHVYYVPTGAEYNALSGTTTYATDKVGTWVTAYMIVEGSSFGYVCDFDRAKYPTDGAQDGYWYVYKKRLGD